MSLTIAEPSNEQRIRQQIESGRYVDVDAVVSQALDVLENEQKLRVLRQLIDEADEDVANGNVFEWTPTSMAEIWAEAEEDDRLGLPIPDHV